MQKVIQLFLVLTIFVGLSFHAQAQCDPDTTTSGVPALYPDTLASGMVGVAYSQTITVVIPQDTTVDIGFPFTLDICSLVLDSIVGLPTGLTFSCNTSNCVWEVDHTMGVINRGCVQISGIPTDTVFNDTISVFATVNPGQYNATTDSCEALDPSSIPPGLTQVEYRPRFRVERDTTAWNTGIEDYNLQELGVKVYPNPTQGQATLSYTLPERTQVAVRLTDILGRQVQLFSLGSQSVGAHELEVGDEELPKGLYFLSLDLGEGANIQTRKLIIE